MSKVFSKFVTSYPKMLFISFLVALSFSILNLNNFKLDASSDSLVLESDDDLKYYREVNSDYASSDFLIVIFKPKEDLFSGETISLVREMVNVLRGLSGLNLVSADVVEVSPAYDHAEVTSLAAATIVYELTNLFAKT